MKRRLVVLSLLVLAAFIVLYYINNTLGIVSFGGTASDGYSKNLTDVSTWETYTDKVNGFRYKYPSGWKLYDSTDRGDSRVRAEINFTSPDLKRYYTGGEFGHMVNESGMETRVFVFKAHYNSFEQMAESLCEQEGSECREVLYNNRKYIIKEERAAHTAATPPNSDEVLYYRVSVTVAGQDNPELYEKVFELMLQNFEIN